MGRLTPQHAQAGFTLVELLVAMVIGLLVMGGATQLFISSQQSYRFQTALADMQDTGRFALDTMARELRQADYSGGCAQSQTTVHIRPWADSNEDALPLQAWNTPSNHDFTASLVGPVEDQDVLAFRGGLINRTGFANNSLTLTDIDTENYLFTTLDRDIDNVFRNQLVLLQGLLNCDIFYNTSSDVRSLQKSPTAGWQGNVDPSDSKWGYKSNIIYSPGQNVSLSALNSAIYYIGQDANNNNAPSLMRLDLSQTTPRNDIVASHVAAMRTAFLIDDAYVPAEEVDAAEWPNVRALRITLIVQSDRPNLRNANTTLALGNFRGENAFTGGDGRIYQAFTTTVSLRNR